MKMSDEDFAYKIGMYIKQAKEDLAWKDGKEEGREEGIDEGVERLIAAVKMVSDGFSLEEASKATGLRINQISQLCGK